MDEFDQDMAEYAHKLSTGFFSNDPPSESSSDQSVVESIHHGRPFRLLDLPEELQLNVVERYFEGAQLELDDTPEGSFICQRIPSLRLERVSKHFCAISMKVRDQIERTLLLDTSVDLGVFVRELQSQLKFTWLRNHVRAIDFIGSLAYPSISDWQQLLDVMPNLASVNYVFVIVCNVTDPTTSTLFSAISNNSIGVAGMLKEGLFDPITPSLDNVLGIDALCNHLDRNRSGRRVVSMCAILQLLTLKGEQLFILVSRAPLS